MKKIDFSAVRQRIIDEFDIKKQANELGVKVWQAPSFLLLLVGFIIVAAMTGVYYVSRHYDDPNVMIMSEVAVATVLLTIGNFIVRSVEEVAKANKMKTEFVSIASHQLKTPLAAINWEVELLMLKFGDGLSDKQKEIINEIASSSMKMGRLVNDLLDVARIDQGRLALNKENLQIEPIIRDVVKANEILARACNITLNVVSESAIPDVVVDKRRIAVVLDNLISNGVKYIKNKGTVDIVVRSEKERVIICVRDTGVGIPHNQQAQVFQKFFRSDNVVKHQTEGTGLGLYISKNIIEQLGGTMWFESVEGYGSSFYFSLPVPAEDNV